MRFAVFAVAPLVVLASACSAAPQPASAPVTGPASASAQGTTGSVPSASTPSSTSAPAQPSAPPSIASAVIGPRLSGVSVVVALGDSVPFGSACGCAPYPSLLAKQLSHVTGHAVSSVNDARPGFTSTDVLTQVQTSASVIADIRSAGVVTLEIGANDIAYSAACGAVASCYAPTLPQVQANITSIVQRIRSLTADRPVAIVLLDYWNVWLGGRYAAAQGPAYVAASTSLTHAESVMISAIAQSTGSAYVDLRLAFRGPDDADDETGLLAPDGDHPNAAGHAEIADVTGQTLLQALPA